MHDYGEHTFIEITQQTTCKLRVALVVSSESNHAVERVESSQVEFELNPHPPNSSVCGSKA